MVHNWSAGPLLVHKQGLVTCLGCQVERSTPVEPCAYVHESMLDACTLSWNINESVECPSCSHEGAKFETDVTVLTTTTAIAFHFEREKWKLHGNYQHPVSIPYRLEGRSDFVIGLVACWDGSHWTLNVYDTFHRPSGDLNNDRGWHELNDSSIMPITMDNAKMSMHEQASLIVYVRRTPTANAQINQLLLGRGHRIKPLPVSVKLPQHPWTVQAAGGSNGDGYKYLLAGSLEILNTNMQKWSKLEKEIKTKANSKGKDDTKGTRKNLMRLQNEHEELWGELRRSALAYLEHYANANRDDDNPDLALVPDQRFLTPIIRALGGNVNTKTLPSESEYTPLFGLGLEGDDSNDSDYDDTKGDNDDDDDDDDDDDAPGNHDVGDDEDDEDNDVYVDEDNDVYDDEDNDVVAQNVAQDVNKISLAADASEEDKQRAKDEGNKVLESIRTTVARLCQDDNFDVTSAEMDEPAMNKVVEAYSTSDAQSAGNSLYPSIVTHSATLGYVTYTGRT